MLINYGNRNTRSMTSTYNCTYCAFVFIFKHTEVIKKQKNKRFEENDKKSQMRNSVNSI